MFPMKWSVPLIPDPSYVSFLARRRHTLASVYFNPGLEGAWDARVQPSDWGPKAISRALESLGTVKAYALFNTRFTTPDKYQDTDFLTQTLDGLSQLHRLSGITGLVITDFYLLHALGRTRHPLIEELEAVPGINCMIDSPEKAFAFLEQVELAGFKRPTRFLADRSLNRNPEDLARFSTRLKQAYPDMDLELLANEGCLSHCPFKLSHDAQISLSNTGSCREMTHEINRKLGCRNYLAQQPEKILASPFIRPEDQWAYLPQVDSFKLCGRTLGPGFLTACIRAYQDEVYTGNLLELLDAAHFLADHYHLDNAALGPDFLQRIQSCTNQCKSCRVCRELYTRSMHPKPVTFKIFKDLK